MQNNYDIIVAGAGPSGMAAAISAARNGAKVLLIEKNGYFGGMNTAALVGPLMTYHSGDKQVVKGFAEEIIQRLLKCGGTIGHVPDPLGVASTITPIEPELLKQVYFQMVQEEENLDVLLHTFISHTSVKDGEVKSVTCVNKSGQTEYFAKMFIDATGDGDIAALSKAEFEEGRPTDGFAQPMTLMFKIGGVDYDKVRSYMRSNPEQFILSSKADIDQYIAISGFFDLVTKAKENGDFNIQRDRVLLFQGINEGEAVINMSRVIKLKGTDAMDLTKAEITAHLQVDEIINFLRKYVPGFDKAFLIQSASTIGVRESRRFKCKYMLSLNDVIEGKDFEDGVAACAFPVDIHDPMGAELNWIRKNKNSYYIIPYRCMQLKKIKNMLVVGRCIGASHEAMASSRITPTVMALGEAAGTAGAIALKTETSFDTVDIKSIQEQLLHQNAVIRKD